MDAGLSTLASATCSYFHRHYYYYDRYHYFSSALGIFPCVVRCVSAWRLCICFCHTPACAVCSLTSCVYSGLTPQLSAAAELSHVRGLGRPPRADATFRSAPLDAAAVSSFLLFSSTPSLSLSKTNGTQPPTWKEVWIFTRYCH